MKKEMEKIFFQGRISALEGCLVLGGVCSGGCLVQVCLVWGSAPGGVWAWGVSALGGVSTLFLGGVCSGGCLVQGCVCSRGCLLWEGGVWSHGGVWSQGVSALGCLLQGGVCSWGCGIPACTEADTPTPL